MISPQQHLDRILAAVEPVGVTTIDLRAEAWERDALGAVLAQDVRSAVMLPGFTNSAMDGYAVRADDLGAASLPVDGDVPAGDTRRLSLGAGRAWRIMTGAPVPDGADSIVPVELTDGGVQTVTFTDTPPAGRHLRLAGEDVRPGDLVLAAGTRLGPHHLAVLASCGVARIDVHARPRVAVISTGDELRPAAEALSHGQIHDSNGPMLAALVEASGACVASRVHVRDTAAEVETALARATQEADVVVTTGGVSAGAYDAVKAALIEAGEVTFDRVAMQPGKPQGFGVLGPRRVPVFTLPGNPMSTLVSYHVFVLPALARMAGRPAPRWERGVVVGDGWAAPAGREQYARVEAVRRHDGRLEIRANRRQGSHHLGELGWANALARVPQDVEATRAGDELDVLALRGC